MARNVKPANMLSDAAQKLVREHAERMVPALVNERAFSLKDEIIEEFVNRLSTEELYDQLARRLQKAYGRVNHFGGMAQVGRIDSSAVDFLQSGIAPRARTVQGKAREIVSVLDHLPDATAEGYGNTTDWSAAFTAALAASDAVFVPRTTTIDGDTGQTVYRLDSMVTVNDDQKLYVDRGVILRRYSLANGGSAATTPVLQGKGIGWEIEGGTIQTQNASPNGVVRCGHEDSTSNYDARWWRLKNCTILGNPTITAGDKCIYVPSGQVTNALKANYFGAIANVNMQNGDILLHIDEMANGHNLSNLQFWNARTANYRITGAYGNLGTNFVFHTGETSGVISIDLVNKSAGTQDPQANSVVGFIVETGGALDVPVRLGTAARYNVLIGNCNTTLGPTNNATNENTLILGMTGAATEFQGNFSDYIGLANTIGLRFAGRADGNWELFYTNTDLTGAQLVSTAAIIQEVYGQSSGYGYMIRNDSGVSLFEVQGIDGATRVLGPLHAAASTAIPAGGTAGTGLKVSSTANFGVFFGSGAPTLAAAKGSLYLRSDGSGTTDRAYINTNGSTTWTALTTVA